MIGAVFGPICALLVFFLPIAGLADNPEAHKLLAIVTFVAFWWICEPVPIPVTSLIAPVLCVVTGVASATDAITYSSGYIPITKMIKAGVLLDIIGVFIITVPLVYFLVKAIMGV